MTQTTDYSEFYRKNHTEIVKLLRSKLGRCTAEDIIQDKASDFYLNMIKYKTLETYSPSKGRFDSYICTALFWPLHRTKEFDKKSRDLCKEDPSAADDRSATETDVWHRINEFKSFLLKYGKNQTLELLSQLQEKMTGEEDIRRSPSKSYKIILDMYVQAEQYCGYTGVFC